MEDLALLLALVALIAAWWLTAKKLKNKHWFLRHLTGSSLGGVAMILVVALFVAIGVVKPQTSEELASHAEPVETLPLNTRDTELEPESVAESTEAQPLGSESQAILDEFTPRMAALVKIGLTMEPLRHSSNLDDLGQCGDLMRQSQAELSSLREEFAAALKVLPAEQSRWQSNFEPLHNAQANLIRCVTCVPTALPSCQEAAKFLRLNSEDYAFMELLEQ